MPCNDQNVPRTRNEVRREWRTVSFPRSWSHSKYWTTSSPWGLLSTCPSPCALAYGCQIAPQHPREDTSLAKTRWQNALWHQNLTGFGNPVWIWRSPTDFQEIVVPALPVHSSLAGCLPPLLAERLHTVWQKWSWNRNEMHFSWIPNYLASLLFLGEATGVFIGFPSLVPRCMSSKSIFLTLAILPFGHILNLGQRSTWARPWPWPAVHLGMSLTLAIHPFGHVLDLDQQFTWAHLWPWSPVHLGILDIQHSGNQAQWPEHPWWKSPSHMW